MSRESGLLYSKSNKGSLLLFNLEVNTSGMYDLLVMYLYHIVKERQQIVANAQASCGLRQINA